MLTVEPKEGRAEAVEAMGERLAQVAEEKVSGR